jgi:hypothetical protein
MNGQNKAAGFAIGRARFASNGDRIAAMDFEDRARQREEDRNRRAAERADAAQARIDRRAAEREEAARLREQARGARNAEDEERRGALAEAREARPKRRATGALSRTGEKPIVRDVRNYRTDVDASRIRELAKRGASVEALAQVFKVSVERIEDALKGVEA